jgi:hypothetical protein
MATDFKSSPAPPGTTPVVLDDGPGIPREHLAFVFD